MCFKIAQFSDPPLAKWLNDLHSESRRPLPNGGGSKVKPRGRNWKMVSLSRRLFKVSVSSLKKSCLGLTLGGLGFLTNAVHCNNAANTIRKQKRIQLQLLFLGGGVLVTPRVTPCPFILNYYLLLILLLKKKVLLRKDVTL